MSIDLPPHVTAHLQTDSLVWLGTVRPDGRPHGVPVWFLWDDAVVLILCNPLTQKVRNLRHNPAVVLMLGNTQQDHDLVTLEGQATLPSMSDVSAMFPAYGEKYGARIRAIRAAALATGATQDAGFTQPILVTLTRLVQSQP